MDLDLSDVYGSQDWFLCSQCKRAFHSKIQLYQHKRIHYIEDYNNAQEDLKRKRVEEWVIQVQLQLQNGNNNDSSELGKENSDMKFPEMDLPGPSQASSSLLEEETHPQSLTKEKRKKKTRSTLAPVSNRVVVTRKRRKSKKPIKAKTPVKNKTPPVRTTDRKVKIKRDNEAKIKQEVAIGENVMTKDVKVVVKLEEYKFCEDCRSTFLTFKEYSHHLPCTESKPRSVQLPRQNTKRKASSAVKRRTKRRRN